jgi:structural maintenance of chromosome 4
MITMGGNAEIELIDSMDPFSEGKYIRRSEAGSSAEEKLMGSGVVLSIMPPKKSWRAIANLSGGEKVRSLLASAKSKSSDAHDRLLLLLHWCSRCTFSR